MALNDFQFGLLQRNIEALIDRLAALNLNVEISYDYAELVGFMQSVEAFINPSFNPKFSTVPKPSFWFRVVDDEGTTIGCHASKIIEAEDFFDLMENERLWFDETAAQDAYGKGHIDAVLRRPSQKVGGKVAHSGALWIHPGWRKKGLSVYLPYLGRALSLRNHQIDFQTTIVLKPLYERGVPTRSYGYQHAELCISGYFPVTGKIEDVYFCYMSQIESVRQVYRLAFHPEFPVGLNQPQ